MALVEAQVNSGERALVFPERHEESALHSPGGVVGILYIGCVAGQHLIITWTSSRQTIRFVCGAK